MGELYKKQLLEMERKTFLKVSEMLEGNKDACVWHEYTPTVSDEDIYEAVIQVFEHGVANLGAFMQLRYDGALKYFNDVEIVLITPNEEYYINLWDLVQSDEKLFLRGVAGELCYAIRELID